MRELSYNSVWRTERGICRTDWEDAASPKLLWHGLCALRVCVQPK